MLSTSLSLLKLTNPNLGEEGSLPPPKTLKYPALKERLDVIFPNLLSVLHEISVYTLLCEHVSSSPV